MLSHRDRRADAGPAPKAARRFAVATRGPLACVACLRVASATRLRRAPCQRAPERDPGHCQLQTQATIPRWRAFKGLGRELAVTHSEVANFLFPEKVRAYAPLIPDRGEGRVSR